MHVIDKEIFVILPLALEADVDFDFTIFRYREDLLMLTPVAVAHLETGGPATNVINPDAGFGRKLVGVPMYVDLDRYRQPPLRS